jgi:hypothetical protein
MIRSSTPQSIFKLVPHRSAGTTQVAPLEEERRLWMESRHDGDETKGSFNSHMRGLYSGSSGFWKRSGRPKAGSLAHLTTRM